jgi:transposase
MKVQDGRKLSHEALEQLRINAVVRVESGESPEEVIKSIGFERVCIYRWIAAYRYGGIAALRAKKLEGRPPILTGEQMMKLFRIITHETPEQYRFPFALWTIAIIRDVIRQLFNVRLSEVSVWRTMSKLGLSPQRPLRRAYQQKPEAVQQFLENEYPKIKAQAKTLGARIYWGDEASIRSDYHSGTTWAEKGKTPIVKTTGARFKVNMVSAIDARGSMRFMVIESGFNTSVFIEFLRRLISGNDNPIFLIVDGHPVHRGKKVKDFVRDHSDKLELYYLPGYSPELNPDELVWNHVKNQTIGKMTIKGPGQLKSVVHSAMQSLAKMPHVIRRFFLAPDLRYIVY